MKTPCCLLLALALPVLADPVALTLEDAFARALEQHPDVRVARLAVDEAAGQYKTARAGTLPHFDARAGASELQRSSEVYGFGEGITYTYAPATAFGTGGTLVLVPDPDDTIGPYSVMDAQAQASYALLNLQTRHAVRAADANTTLQEHELAALREAVLADVAARYNHALFSARAVEVRREGAALREQRAQLMRDAQTAGAATELDVREEDLKLALARQKLRAAENEDAATRRELTRLLGFAADTVLDLKGSLRFRPIRLHEQAGPLDAALARRPDFLALQQAERVAEHGVDAARAQRWPRVTLSGAFGVQGEDFSDATDVWSIGAGISVPLWDGFKIDGDVEQAESRLARQQVRTESLANAIGAEIATAADALTFREQAVATAQQAVALAEASLTQVRDAAAAGDKTPLDVLQARLDLSEAVLDEGKAVDAYNTACITWFKATGNVALYAPVVGAR
jgi:outer membrane protein TolC